jgi:hypothetical protein
MGRFLLKLNLFLPLLLLTAWLNWTVDPARLFGGHSTDPLRHEYEVVIAKDLLAGRPHDQIAPYDDGLVNELIYRNRRDIEVLVLGSSIAKPLHAAGAADATFFNASLYGAKLEEMIAEYEVARRNGVRPRRVVIQIDGSLLGRRPAAPSETTERILRPMRQRLAVAQVQPLPAGETWMQRAEALFPGTPAAARAAEHGLFPPYDTLLSPRYLQFSLQSLPRYWVSITDPSKIRIVEQFSMWNQHRIFPDGSVEWCLAMRDRTPEDLRAAAFDPLTLVKESLRPTAEHCRLFEAFVSDLLGSGMAVEIVLTPPNPWFFAQAKQRSRTAGRPLPSEENEAYIRAFADRYSIPIIGSLDPVRARVSERNYVDEVHFRRDVILLKERDSKKGRAAGRFSAASARQ